MNSIEDSRYLPNTGSFLSTLLVCCIVYSLYCAVYDVFFHPLSKFPGPLWARLTRIPYWIASIKGEQIFFMQRLHAKYGPVVRFSPMELSYTDGRAWKDVYGHGKGRSENLKAKEFQYVMSFNKPPKFQSSDRPSVSRAG